MTTSPPDSRVERLLRDMAPQVLGAVVRRFRDFAACEDAVQEALIAAAAQWPRDGVPDSPRAWLIHVALRRMTDYARSEISRRNREAAVAEEVDVVVAPMMDGEPAIDPDDTLVLLFMCCHPALPPASAIALTLRAVGGLTTAEIAKAFLVPESTIGQRISRAKRSIRASHVPFRLPDADERAQRLSSVLHVLYLVFNEGYTTSAGAELHRTDLSNEAIRLTREVHRLLPDNGDVSGLLALMLLTDARRAARTGAHGELIPLDEQDRTLWDRQAIVEGVALASAALSQGSVGEYQLQAAIAAVHDEAARAEDTDWPQIRALYGMLMRMTDNPLVALNHAIATAMVEGPNAGLALLAPLQGDERLRGSHRLHAVRAHLLERVGERDAAVRLYREAASKTTSVPERDYLLMKAARVSEATTTSVSASHRPGSVRHDYDGTGPRDVTVDERDWLGERFEENRIHLRAVAYRMLGSRNEADDAVQESWLRLSRADTSPVENLKGWLTTVVARVCLDMLRSRKARPEEPLDARAPIANSEDGTDPDHETLMADSVGLALLVVLKTLTPAERVAFVLHDMFGLPFDEIAPIVGRSPSAARQLASRARRRVQGAATPSDVDRTRQRALVDAFLAASRGGDFDALLAVLDPDVVLRADPAAVHMGAAAEVRGAKTVADTFKGRAQAAQPALVNGAAGLVWAAGGRPRVVFEFTTTGGKIVAIDLVADPERLRQLDLVVLND